MAEENIQTNAPEQDLSEILKVRREKLAALRAEGRDPFKETRFDVTHHAQDIKDNFDALEGSEVRVAGRLMSKRGMGKVSFCDLQDKSGRIQLYARKDEMDEEEYNRFKKYDIGDIVGVEGEVFRTQRGEMSVRAKKITLLSKSLRPLPEKYHGLTDKEARYRQRYVDLIINPESKRNFEIRSKFVAYLRRYLDSIGFMEVETPVLSPIAGGANARPFITHHNTLDIDMYMRIATELHLKRLIVGGMERVYEVGRIFRNEGMDTKHNPEFTTCELYQAYTNLDGMMDILEAILSGAAKEILGTYQIQWLGKDIDLTPSWKRITMADAGQGSDRRGLYGDRGRRRGRRRARQERRRRHGQRGQDLGQRPVCLLRSEGGGEADPAHLHHHVSCGGQPPDQAQPCRSPADGTLRAVYLPQRAGQRLFRAERPHRPAPAL